MAPAAFGVAFHVEHHPILLEFSGDLSEEDGESAEAHVAVLSDLVAGADALHGTLCRTR